MSERATVEERLRKKRTELQNLEEKARAAKIYIAALEDILRLLSEDTADEVTTKLRAGSSVAKARDIILARGEPMHIDELLEAMGKKVTRDSKSSLASSLAAYVRQEEIFSRPGPNTYGLIELGHREEDIEDDEPPPGFGGGSDDLEDDIPF